MNAVSAVWHIPRKNRSVVRRNFELKFRAHQQIANIRKISKNNAKDNAEEDTQENAQGNAIVFFVLFFQIWRSH